MPDPAVLSAIDQALKGLRYGTVQLTVHDGRLVRVERLERIRLSSETKLSEEPTGIPGGQTKDPG